jgi:nucleoside-diphosphate-sugar epimerase
MKKRILITGADGFTGRYLATQARLANYETHGLVRGLDAKHIDGFDRLYGGDLSESASLTRMINDIKPDYVVHLAAISFVAHGDVEAIYRTNVVGTRHLLDALATAAHKPQAVLLTSSANVYGNSTGGILDENTLPKPANDYAVSKLAMEYVAQLYTDSLPIIIARPFNYTGVGQADNFLIPKIVSHFRQKAAFIELGNVDVARDFSDVRTVVASYLRLLQTPEAIHQVVNVCSGHAYQLNDVIEMLSVLSGHQLDVRFNPNFARANEVKVLQGDRAKLENLIGVIDDIPFQDTLKWMLDMP